MSDLQLLLAKGVASGTLIVLVNVLARREPTIAGMLVAFPFVTLLSVLWLRVDDAGAATIGRFLYGVLLGLVPTIGCVLAMVVGSRTALPLLAVVAIGVVAWLVLAVVMRGVPLPADWAV